MPNMKAYQRHLAANGLSINDVPKMFDGKEVTSLLAITLGNLTTSISEKDYSKILLPALNNINKSSNDVLFGIHKNAVKEFKLNKNTFAGIYPNALFDGEVLPAGNNFFGRGGYLILINFGAMQIIGAAVQLLYSSYSPLKKAKELRRLVENYVGSLEIPENSEYTGTWSTFSLPEFVQSAALVTAAETFLLLHEHGHIARKDFKHDERSELAADLWALNKICEVDYGQESSIHLGAIIFFGLCYAIEQVSIFESQMPSGSRTHPGANLRLAQAILLLAKLFSTKEFQLAQDFLNMIDGAVSKLTPSSNGYTVNLLKCSHMMGDFFSLVSFDALKKNVDVNILKELDNIASDETKKVLADKNETHDFSLPPGLTRYNEEDNLYYWELPSGISIELVYVPPGKFLFGPVLGPGFPSEDDFEGAGSPREVEVESGYFIGRYPISVSEYESFCLATGFETPQNPDWQTGPHMPVVNVTVSSAEAFCRWAGVELPSERQWEKAARGTDGSKLPNASSSEALHSYLGRGKPRPNQPDNLTVSPYGAHNMIGNVWEITSNWLKSDSAMNAGQYRVVRGVSYSANLSVATLLSRFRVMPDFTTEQLGFRVLLNWQVEKVSEQPDWMSGVLDEQKPNLKGKATACYKIPRGAKKVAERLFKACSGSPSNSDVEAVKLTIENYPEAPLWINEDGYTALLKLAETVPYFENAYKIAELLVQNGADVNAQTPFGSTALNMLACQPMYYALEIADLLLKNGADPSIQDSRGVDAEMTATRFQPMMGDGFVALLSFHRNDH